MADITPTRGESLLIWRRRLGMSQVDAAADMGVSPDRYRDWESDRITGGDQPRRQLGRLRPREACLLRRRRAGLTQRELAVKMGITRLWLIKMEDGSAPVDRLRDYWEA